MAEGTEVERPTTHFSHAASTVHISYNSLKYIWGVYTLK